MNKQKFNFIWLEPGGRSKPLSATMYENATLRLGDSLVKVLPEHIKFGYDSELKVLEIAETQAKETGADCVKVPKGGNIKMEQLFRLLYAVGLKFPVRFNFDKDPYTGYYLGHIVPPINGNGQNKEYDVEQLMIIYQNVLKEAINKGHKSIPKPERKAFAEEAFCQAAKTYKKQYGSLESYLSKHICYKLDSEMKHFTCAYAMRSLDSVIEGSNGSTYNLYDLVADVGSGGIGSSENKMMMEQFLSVLSGEERNIIKMLLGGLTLNNVSEKLNINIADIKSVCENISVKWKRFNAGS